MTNGFWQCVCLPVCVRAHGCIASTKTFWLTGNKGHTEIVIHQVRGHKEKGSQLELPWFCCHAPCSCLFITLGQKTCITCTQQGTTHFQAWKSWEKIILLYCGKISLVLPGKVCSWCCLVSYGDLLHMLTFVDLLWEINPWNNEHAFDCVWHFLILQLQIQCKWLTMNRTSMILKYLPN